MDFRSVQVDRLEWRCTPGGKYKCVYGGGGKVLFQTPRITARITPCPRFPGAVELAIDGGVPGAFREFLDAVRQTVVPVLNPTPEMRYLDPLRKLTAFNDTLAFDADGSLLTQCMQTLGSRARLSCLLGLDGAWTSEQYWGLRLKVVQLKLYEIIPEVVETTSKVLFFEDGVPMSPPSKKMKFLDDDSP